VAGVLNTRWPQGTPERVKAQEPRLVEPAPCFGMGYYRRAKRQVGASGRKRPGYLSGGGSSEGRISGALPVRNKTGAGSQGVSRQEGNQTLKAERSGQAKPVASGPPIPHVL
jgi:hypothetical protein